MLGLKFSQDMVPSTCLRQDLDLPGTAGLEQESFSEFGVRYVLWQNEQVRFSGDSSWHKVSHDQGCDQMVLRWQGAQRKDGCRF